jgi:exonuclease SbcC
MAMKLLEHRLQGIGCFRDEVSLPIMELENARIVVVTGKNGAGKTTLMESVPGAMYGSVPSHGLLSAMANRPDSFVETGIETDQKYLLRRTVNATRKQPKIEAYLFDEAGRPLNDGKQTTFEQEVARRFPSSRVYLASGYAAQNRGGQFLEISKADRKAMFAEMLGLGALQELSEAAGQQASEHDSERQRLVSSMNTLKPRAEISAVLRARLTEARIVEEEARAKVAELEKAAQAAQHELDAWEKRRFEVHNGTAKANEALITANHSYERAFADLSAAKQRATENREAQDAILVRLQKRDSLAKLAGGEDNAQEIERVTSEIDNARNVERARQEAENTLRLLEQRLVAAERVAGDDLKTTHALADVPCRGEGEFAGCPLIQRAISARNRRDENAMAVEAAKVAVEHQQEKIRVIPKAVNTQDLADSLVKLRAEQRRRDQAKGELVQLDAACVTLGELEIDADELVFDIERKEEVLDAAGKTLENARQWLADAGALQRKHDAVRPKLTTTDLNTWRKQQTDAAVEVGKLEKAVELAREAAQQIDEIEKDLTACVANVDDWKHLQKAFGRDGVQALEIDAAGPEVSELINELLHSCYGPRFTVALETTAQKKDGKGSKEVFDLRVIDAESGTDGSASDLSGGERVIVAEALSLAIATYNAQRSAIPIHDLFRDEVAGALDYENAPRYVAMLRRALELGGFHRVYFVAHQRELFDLADARIVVADGKAEVAT